LLPVRAFSIADNVAKARLRVLVVPEFVPDYRTKEIDFCGLIDVDLFGPLFSELCRHALNLKP